MKLLIDPNYNPDLQSSISSATKLGPGITCAKFLGARGSRTQFEKLYQKDFFGKCDRLQIARNLVLHAKILQSVVGVPDFINHRLVVSEGLYEPNPKFQTQEIPASSESAAKKLAQSNDGGTYGKGPDGWVARVPIYIGEQPTANSVNDKRRDGRSIVYQLIDKKGKTDPRKTFDLAVHWSDYIDYDKITLDYDTFDPNGDMVCQIIVETPEVPRSYEVQFKYSVATRYNGELQSEGDLIEILPE